MNRGLQENEAIPIFDYLLTQREWKSLSRVTGARISGRIHCPVDGTVRMVCSMDLDAVVKRINMVVAPKGWMGHPYLANCSH